MDDKAEVRDFLVTRRARISPDETGLPAYGSNRRVAGLRREEVAMLAGLSVDYYTKLERGNLAGASESVLANVSRALQLDEAETEHLFDLARRANAGPIPRRKQPAPRIRSSIRQVLDAIDDAPAWVRNARYDILATNRLAHALLMQAFVDPVRPANLARFMFLDPAAKTFWRDWEIAASDAAAYLRAEAARNPHDKDLSDLVGELATRGKAFPPLWAKHDVRFHRTGHKKMHHPVVGDLDLNFEAMEFPSDPGLVLTVYTAEPGTPSADALQLLATWAATQDQFDAAGTAVTVPGE
ncbi:transcriptional regulator [Mycolicibacterium setense]|uniref:helix-turn-helix transcriptional regulator n=1 Tax=Mycolicibacterium setense TaxID=431269 RepID=UPI0007EA50B1|nr:helix-turn-helix transcriptional regulator [Mycolicibacterium setense]OBB20733.1 transcriptional regulator [Mycolicibacterium setense]